MPVSTQPPRDTGKGPQTVSILRNKVAGTPKVPGGRKSLQRVCQLQNLPLNSAGKGTAPLLGYRRPKGQLCPFTDNLPPGLTDFTP